MPIFVRKRSELEWCLNFSTNLLRLRSLNRFSEMSLVEAAEELAVPAEKMRRREGVDICGFCSGLRTGFRGL